MVFELGPGPQIPDEPVFVFDPQILRDVARRFQAGYPGLVSFAVKANPDPVVLRGLMAAGIDTFDVASVAEMRVVRALMPLAVLHYHNPVRSRAEIAQARALGVVSWSIDRMSELDKLGDIAGHEIAVRLRLPVAGAAYDFGSKFGADPEQATQLLRAVAARGGVASMTFHPGTQCEDTAAWGLYIAACARIAAAAGVALHRLNTGGGFPAHRNGAAPDLSAHFDAIRRAADQAFGGQPPALVCEPGRAMVADAVDLLVPVKAVDGTTVFLSDGIYGGLTEWRNLASSDRITVLDAQGALRTGPSAAYDVFGPTCDSIDRLPGPVALPQDLCDSDVLVFHGLGAYGACLATQFNGYGPDRMILANDAACVVAATGQPAVPV